MPQPSASDVHVNRPLTNISVAYIQQASDFVAGQVFPQIGVAKQSDRYFKYPKEFWFRNMVQKRAPATESAGGGWDLDNTPSYFCEKFAIHQDLDDDIRQNQDDPLNLDRDATQWVTQQRLQKRDIDWAAEYFKKSVWGVDRDGVSATPTGGQFLQWNDSSSDPVTDVSNSAVEITENTGYRPNTLVVGPYVYNELRNNASILDRIKYTQRGQVSRDLLASLFDVDKFVVAWGTKDAGEDGSAQSDADMGFIFGKGALLVYSNPTPSLMTPSGGYIFSWTGLMGAGAFGNRINRFRKPEIQSDRVEGEMAYDMKVVAPDVATFFATAVA